MDLVEFLLLLFFSIIFSNNTKNEFGKYFLPISFIILFFFSAFRFNGWYSDYGRNYYHVLEMYEIPLSSILQSSEFLHNILFKLIAVIFRDPIFYFVVTSFTILFSYYLFSKRYIKNDIFFVLAFFCAYGYSTINNITRQALAGSLALFGFMFLLDKKKRIAFLFFLFSFLIHNSSLLILLLLILMKINFTRKVMIAYIILIVVAVPLFLFLLPYIQLFFYSDYDVGHYGMEPANFLNIIKIIPVAFSIIFLMVKQNDYIFSDKENLLKNLTLHGGMLYLFFMILTCQFALIFVRLAHFFIPFALLAIDKMWSLFREKNIKAIYFMTLYLFLFSWFIVLNLERDSVAEKKFIWQVENRPVIESYY